MEGQQPSKRAQDYAAVEDWPGYFRMMEGTEPRETLVHALDGFEREHRPPGYAIDLGCGEGRDTLALLDRGWRVLALDGHPAAFEHLLPRVPSEQKLQLTHAVRHFAMTELPPADLVNASFSLPFCPPPVFPRLWQAIIESLQTPGARFSGQFFGDRDDWASIPGRTHHSEQEARMLLQDFEIERFDTDEHAAGDPGRQKHWHVFHVVARRP